LVIKIIDLNYNDIKLELYLKRILITNNSDGGSNTGIKYSCLVNVISGSNNTAIGNCAGNYIYNGKGNTFLKYKAGIYHCKDNWANSTCIGANSRITGSNQVQLGNYSSQTYTHGSLQYRSDERDAADVRNTVLGLDFIKQLRPVDYKYDFRDSYQTNPPALINHNPTSEAIAEYNTQLQTWNESNKFENLVANGTNKGTTYHHGFIAQEVGELGTFGGYNDLLLSGGEDIKSLGYTEFIAPLVKAVQELSSLIEALTTRVANLENIID